MLYKWTCSCGEPLTTNSRLNDQPPTTACPKCDTIHSSAAIDITAETFGYDDGTKATPVDDSLLPRHKRIRKPMDPRKLKRYKDLEKAEQERIRRMDGEDTDD